MLGESMRRRRKVDRSSSRTKKKPSRRRRPARRTGWGRVLLLAVVLAGVFFGTGYAVAAFVLFPVPEEAGEGVQVPELVGRPLAEAQAEVRRLGLEVEAVTELPTPGGATGVVVAQTPLPGQHLRPGAAVRLAVGTEAPALTLPDVTGFTGERAEELLTGLGFQVDRRQEPAPEPAGRVVRTEPEAGSRERPPAHVVIVVSSGPPEPVVPEIIDPMPVVPDSMMLPGPETGPGSDATGAPADSLVPPTASGG